MRNKNGDSPYRILESSLKVGTTSSITASNNLHEEGKAMIKGSIEARRIFHAQKKVM
jgi:hypothetical protein